MSVLLLLTSGGGGSPGGDLDAVVIDADPGEAALALDAVVIDADPGEARAGVPTTPSYYTGGLRPRWRVRVVGLASASYVGYGECPSAEPTWTETLNQPTTARVTVSTSDPSWPLLEFVPGARLVEIWLDGDLKMRGYPTRGSINIDGQTCTFQVIDELFPLQRNVFGRADRPNMVTNGGFDGSASSIAPWVQSGGATVTVDATVVNEGSRSLKMVGGGTGGTYVYNWFTYSHSYPPGLILRLVAWYFIPAGGASPDGNLAGVIKITDSATDDSYYEGFTIDDDAPRGAWERRYCDIMVSKANVPYLVEVRLYNAPGTIYWDSVQVVRNEAVTLDYPGEDQAVMFRKIVEYAQDPAEGKSSLGVATDCPSTGVSIITAYTHADHRSQLGALQELASRSNGPDFSLVLTPGLTTFKTHYPAKGSTHREWQLEAGRNLAGGSFEIDGSQCATSVIVLGDTADFAREEGGAVDTSQSGGIVLERVIRSEPNTAIRFLDEIATQEVADARDVVVLPQLTVVDFDRELIHGLEVGDTIPVRVDVGLTQIDGVTNYRVIAKTVPASADRLTLELAPA